MYKNKIIAALGQATDELILAHIYNDVLKNTDELRSQYERWSTTQTQEIFDLHIASLMCEDYFDDMCLTKKSIVGKYLDTPYEDSKDDDDYTLSIDAHFYKFYITDEEECDGYTDIYNRTITIHRKHINDKNILLHEMLHAHEHIINSAVPVVRDILIIELYNHLKKHIQDLDKLIYNHANLLHNLELTDMGGNHSVLFMLKSLDLDLRLNNELFTVFGYDYTRNFKELGLI